MKNVSEGPYTDFFKCIFPEIPLPGGSYGAGIVAGNQNLTSAAV